MTTRDRSLLMKIQLIHQSPDIALNPRQRVSTIVGRVVLLRERLRGDANRARVTALLESAGLSAAFLDSFPGELSGGQKQRVCIARALAADPRLIICDEITSALDHLVAKGILETLGRLRQDRGTALLFITHDLSLAADFADEIMVMHRGRVVEQGPTQAVLGAPRDAYTRRLLAAVPSLTPGWLESGIASGRRPESREH